jgi:hypothetical protein
MNHPTPANLARTHGEEQCSALPLEPEAASLSAFPARGAAHRKSDVSDLPHSITHRTSRERDVRCDAPQTQGPDCPHPSLPRLRWRDKGRGRAAPGTRASKLGIRFRPDSQNEADRALRITSNLLGLWGLCAKPACRRARACKRNARNCVERYAPLVPEEARIGVLATIEAARCGIGDEQMRADASIEIAALESWIARVHQTARSSPDSNFGEKL